MSYTAARHSRADVWLHLWKIMSVSPPAGHGQALQFVLSDQGQEVSQRMDDECVFLFLLVELVDATSRWCIF